MPFTQGGITYQVTPDYVHQAGTNCMSTATEVATQLQNLQRWVIGLESDWRGIASNQFQQLMADYQANSAALYEALTAIGTSLGGTATNYTDGEQSNFGNLAGVHLPTAKLD